MPLLNDSESDLGPLVSEVIGRQDRLPESVTARVAVLLLDLKFTGRLIMLRAFQQQQQRLPDDILRVLVQLLEHDDTRGAVKEILWCPKTRVLPDDIVNALCLSPFLFERGLLTDSGFDQFFNGPPYDFPAKFTPSEQLLSAITTL